MVARRTSPCGPFDAAWQTEFIGKIGRDRFGQLAEEDLGKEGVVGHFVESDEHLTGCVAVFVDETGERSMVSGRGADFYLLPSELPKDTVRRARHLHMTAWSFFVDPPRSAARAAARLASECGSTLSFDPGSFQMIEEMGVNQFLSVTQDLGIDVFLPNYQEGEVLTGLDDPEAIAAALAKLYPQALIMLKLDADGALVYDNGVATHIPPATNNLVDATGAGDSFAGAFLARYPRRFVGGRGRPLRHVDLGMGDRTPRCPAAGRCAPSRRPALTRRRTDG